MSFAMLCGPRFYFIGVVPIPVAAEPIQVLDRKQQPPVALDLLKMLALVTQQALVVLMAGQHVDGAPERRPAFEAAQAHIGGNQAGGSADGH